MAYDDNPLAYVAESPIHGHGLFARRQIHRDDYIGTYDGVKTRRNGTHVLWLWDEDEEDWVGVNGLNEMRFLNHSSAPNAEFWGDELYAVSTIEVGEEITFDYGWAEF